MILDVHSCAFGAFHGILYSLFSYCLGSFKNPFELMDGWSLLSSLSFSV